MIRILKKSILSIFLLMTFSHTLYCDYFKKYGDFADEGEPITMKNLKNHEEIKKIENIILEVQKKTKNLEKYSYSFNIRSKECNTSFPVRKFVYVTDIRGNLRFFRLERDLPDGEVEIEIYYDEYEKMRFFVWGDLNANHEKHYYDNNEEFIWAVDLNLNGKFEELYAWQVNIPGYSKAEDVKQHYIENMSAEFHCPLIK